MRPQSGGLSLLWRLHDVGTQSVVDFNMDHYPQNPYGLLHTFCDVEQSHKAYDRTVFALTTWAPDAIISIGTCGALEDAKIGDIRTGTSLFEDQGTRSQLDASAPFSDRHHGHRPPGLLDARTSTGTPTNGSDRVEMKPPLSRAQVAISTGPSPSMP